MRGSVAGMSESAEDVVRRNFASYVKGDRDTAEKLIGADFVFTSPQDDHIDRAAFFERCFPTSDRFSYQELKAVAPVGDQVFVMYEYELAGTGERYRNAELLTVRDGQVVEAQVFFGGRVR
jgi:ketosteroid isomerase-like protein